MPIDANTLRSGEIVDTDICIVGAGPAGITLASEFAGENFRVCLLESGGTEPDERTQNLAAGELVSDPTEPPIGPPLEPPHGSRARMLGGTSHLWNSKLAQDQIGFRGGPLAVTDFEKKDWMPHSGWPFGREHLDPYYERAHSVCKFGPYRYEAASWETDVAARFPLDENVLATSLWQFSSQNTFLEAYRERVAEAHNITTYLHANVVDIEMNDSCSAVTRVRVAGLGGGRFWVRAKMFILAAGGIENARLLLISDKQQRGGIGNGYDLVGRYFMEHQIVRSGTFFPASRELFNRAGMYAQWVADGVPVMGKIDFTDEVLRREKLMNVSAMLLPKHRWHRRVRQESVDSFAEMLRSFRRLSVPPNLFQHAKRTIRGLDYVIATVLRKASRDRLFPYFVPSPRVADRERWSELESKHKRFSYFEVMLHTEQSPDPENRVTLGEDLDELGCRRVRLHWRWREFDFENVRRAQELLAAEFQRAGLGRLRIELNRGRPDLYGSNLHHHMGTTRMDADPKRGVVDPQGRVHGVSNLFISSCSVFPTGGYINPTLTIVALAIRLADHLKASWGSNRA